MNQILQAPKSNLVPPSPQASLASLTVSVPKLGLDSQEVRAVVGIPSGSLKTSCRAILCLRWQLQRLSTSAQHRGPGQIQLNQSGGIQTWPRLTCPRRIGSEKGVTLHGSWLFW